MDIMKECVICGEVVTGRGRTCSNSCRGKLSNIDKGKGRKLATSNCIVCGSEFEVRHDLAGINITCGDKCSREQRRQKMLGDKNHQYGLKGDKNDSWRGGRYINSHGYVRVHCPEHPNSVGSYVLEHIKVMSDYLGRPLDTSVEAVHHRDENKQNNDISNPQLMSYEEHSRYHRMKEESRERDLITGRFI
jgi:predicted nucleic acid-binding Zn ribbon protein